MHFSAKLKKQTAIMWYDNLAPFKGVFLHLWPHFHNAIMELDRN
jgi:hypothetical protein